VIFICPHADSGAVLWTVLQLSNSFYFAIWLLAQSELVTGSLEIILCKNLWFYLTRILYLVSGARCSPLLLIYLLYYEAIEFRIHCLVRPKNLNIRHIFLSVIVCAFEVLSRLLKETQ
jgi:hypothetical protein